MHIWFGPETMFIDIDYCERHLTDPNKYQVENTKFYTFSVTHSAFSYIHPSHKISCTCKSLQNDSTTAAPSCPGASPSLMTPRTITPFQNNETSSVSQPSHDVSTETSHVGTITEPDCLGPCEPGTSVSLEGIVWQETENGKYRQEITKKSLIDMCLVLVELFTFTLQPRSLSYTLHALIRQTNTTICKKYTCKLFQNYAKCPQGIPLRGNEVSDTFNHTRMGVFMKNMRKCTTGIP
jgi:hypothetical protein